MFILVILFLCLFACYLCLLFIAPYPLHTTFLAHLFQGFVVGDLIGLFVNKIVVKRDDLEHIINLQHIHNN